MTPEHRALCILLLSSFPTLAPSSAWSQGQQVAVEGQVLSAGAPVPGVQVYLIHPTLGRTPGARTNGRGMYSFEQIPVFRIADPRAAQFYVEVYWGRELVARHRLLLSMELAGAEFRADARGRLTLMPRGGASPVNLGPDGLRTSIVPGPVPTLRVDPVLLR